MDESGEREQKVGKSCKFICQFISSLRRNRLPPSSVRFGFFVSFLFISFFLFKFQHIELYTSLLSAFLDSFSSFHVHRAILPMAGGGRSDGDERERKRRLIIIWNDEHMSFPIQKPLDFSIFYLVFCPCSAVRLHADHEKAFSFTDTFLMSDRRTIERASDKARREIEMKCPSDKMETDYIEHNRSKAIVPSLD